MADSIADLTAFIRARLDEDEQVACAAGNRRWLVQDNIIELYPEREDDGFMSWPTRADARHAANWDPIRVLREVEAKRRLLDFWSIAYSKPEDFPGVEWEKVRANAAWTVRLLALPYADHPDYREQWRP